jgi:hypothetical protein
MEEDEWHEKDYLSRPYQRRGRPQSREGESRPQYTYSSQQRRPQVPVGATGDPYQEYDLRPRVGTFDSYTQPVGNSYPTQRRRNLATANQYHGDLGNFSSYPRNDTVYNYVRKLTKRYVCLSLLTSDWKPSRTGRYHYATDLNMEDEWHDNLRNRNPFTEPPVGLAQNSRARGPAPNVYEYPYPRLFSFDEDAESEDEQYINLSFLEKETLKSALATNASGPSLDTQSPTPSIGRNGSLKVVQQPSAMYNIIHSRYSERDSANGEAVIELLSVPNLTSPSGKKTVPAFRWM